MVFGGVVVSLLLSLTTRVQACVQPAGFGNGVGEINETTPDFTPAIFPRSLGGNYFQVTQSGVTSSEPAIEFRYNMYISMLMFSMGAAYEPIALDAWGRATESEDRRRCSDLVTPAFYSLHRQTTFAYSFYFFGLEFAFQENQASLATYLPSFNLDPRICDQPGFDCSDVATPWGLARVLVDELVNFGKFDGWNADGSLTRQVNPVPFEDFTGYVPQNTPYELTEETAWQPLQETDTKGFIFNQQHVVPQIAVAGKSIYLTDDAICNMEAPDPNYDYDDEIQLAIDRLANITDRQKMLVEFFDRKSFSIGLLLGFFFVFRGISLDDFRFIRAQLSFNLAIYEGTLVVWKEKIRYDRVRPPSIVRERKNGETITSYAGRTQAGKTLGTQSYDGKDWNAYIRTMPHAEYPSLSACICEAAARSEALFSGDSIPAVLGFPLTRTFAANSSSVEPLSTPAQDFTEVFASWSQVSNLCGQSRLDGGMHFTASVPESKSLCGPIADIIFDRVSDLLNGTVPTFVVDINDQNIRNRQCDGNGKGKGKGKGKGQGQGSGFNTNTAGGQAAVISIAAVATVVVIIVAFLLYRRIYKCRKQQRSVFNQATKNMNDAMQNDNEIADEPNSPQPSSPRNTNDVVSVNAAPVVQNNPNVV